MEKSESPWPVGNTFTGVVAGSCGRSGEGPDETVTTVADFDGLQMRLVGLVGSEVGFETFISAVRFVATPDGPATDFNPLRARLHECSHFRGFYVLQEAPPCEKMQLYDP